MATNGKYYFIIYLLISSFNFKATAQTGLYRTLYYENGSIRNKMFTHDIFTSGYPQDSYYERSKAVEQLGRHIADTVYFDLTKETIIGVRNYYLDSTLIIKDFQHNNPEGQRISNSAGGFKIIFQSFLQESLFCKLWINRDSTINSIFLGVEDTIEERSKLTLADIRFNEGTTLKNPFHVDLSKWGSINIWFTDKSFIQTIQLLGKEENVVYTRNFYFENNNLIQSGDWKDSTGRVGKWYEYYEDGTLKATGFYAGTKVKHSIVKEGIVTQEVNDIKQIKDGEWLYYNSFGELIRQENWNRGVLEKNYESKNVKVKIK